LRPRAFMGPRIEDVARFIAQHETWLCSWLAQLVGRVTRVTQRNHRCTLRETIEAYWPLMFSLNAAGALQIAPLSGVGLSHGSAAKSNAIRDACGKSETAAVLLAKCSGHETRAEARLHVLALVMLLI
jgi:hypothetical protein